MKKLTSKQKFKIASMYSGSLLMMTEVSFNPLYVSGQDHSNIVGMVSRIGAELLNINPQIGDFDEICKHVINQGENGS